MSEKKLAEGEVDPLALKKIYPDAGAVFLFQPEALSTVLSACLVVLDTNVLLVPYNTGKASLSKIREIYSNLSSKRRLIIPGHVAREFVGGRPEQLRNIFQQLSRKRDKSSLDTTGYPLLESLAEYQELIKLENDIGVKLSEYRKKLSALLEAIQSWHWNDPVSLLYRELFDENVIYDPEISEKEFLADLSFRNSNKIPPGYKDSGKPNGGAGDLLIWKTILDLGRRREEHVVFVSGDEKPDWWYQSEKQALYPRFELVEEFRQASNGKSLHIIRFAELLKLFGAPPGIVREVREGEALVDLELMRTGEALGRDLAVRSAVHRWIRSLYSPEQLSIAREVDFIVKEHSGSLGFEVKIIRESTDISELLSAGILELQNLIIKHRLVKLYLVCVLEEAGGLAMATSQLAQLPPSRWIGFIIGFIGNSGVFEEIARI